MFIKFVWFLLDTWGKYAFRTILDGLKNETKAFPKIS